MRQREGERLSEGFVYMRNCECGVSKTEGEAEKRREGRETV